MAAESNVPVYVLYPLADELLIKGDRTVEQTNRSLFRAEEEFFVIDSEHLENVKTAFYGYTFSEYRVTDEQHALNGLEPDADGAWVYVRRENDRVRITQDFQGCYGLYLFRKDGYFALSNSFLTLVEYLIPSQKLTLNCEYADYLLFVDLLASCSMEETPAKEISVLDRSSVVDIDIVAKTLDIRMMDYREGTVDPGTEEGIALLDDWWKRWTSRFLYCVKTEGLIWNDLSGGFDSRITTALLLSSGMDMEKVYVFSKTDELHTHTDDYRIASEIAEHYGFKLNNKKLLSGGSVPFCQEEILGISWRLMLGFHKQMYYKQGWHRTRRFGINGKGGGSLRDFWEMDEEELTRTVVEDSGIFANIPRKQRERMQESTRKVMGRSFETLRGKYRAYGRSIPEGKDAHYLYMDTRGRNHFGKSAVESYFANTLSFSPLLDSRLHRLRVTSDTCTDGNFIFALVLDRYAPDLLAFPFDRGRIIAPETVEAAREVNRRYPFELKPVMVEPLAGQMEKKTGMDENRPSFSGQMMDAVMLTAYRSPAFRKLFTRHYGNAVYNAILRHAASLNYHPLMSVYAAFGIGLMLWADSPQRNKNQGYIQYLLQNADLSAQGPVRIELPGLSAAEWLALLAKKLRG